MRVAREAHGRHLGARSRNRKTVGAPQRSEWIRPGFQLVAPYDKGPVESHDRDECPEPEYYEDIVPGDGDGGYDGDGGASTGYECLVRFWHYGGEVYRVEVIYCWKDE